MAFIDIHTNNLSRELRNNLTYADNWVFVPGTAITGDPDIIHEFTSLSQFQDTCGTHGPIDSITYEYVAGLLSAGLPVLFKRITKGTDKSTVKQASVQVTHTEEVENDTVDLEIKEKYGGTFGNDMSVVIRQTDTAYYMEVYLNEITLLESQRIITYNKSSDTQEQISQKIMDALKNTITFERIDVEVKQTDAKKFKLATGKQHWKLTGGEDVDESKIEEQIPIVYKELTDKILFHPKFITSGGHTDKQESPDNPIATAMMDLTLTRQDCRALVDLARDIPLEEQIDKAREFQYQQTSNTQAIPSASMCAPWVYMQVGSTQKWMPPSFAYLMVVGDALSRGGNTYTPKAGLSNGIVPNIIRTQYSIGSDIVEAWQSDEDVNINPIMRLQGGSYVIDGNSTLLVKDINADEENAFSESSADLTVIEIRRFVYNLATELQYQYNSVTAFETFSLRTAKFLDAMISEGAVTKYDIENISTNQEPRKLKVRLDVYLTPTIKNIEIYLNVSYGSIEVITGGVE